MKIQVGSVLREPVVKQLPAHHWGYPTDKTLWPGPSLFEGKGAWPWVVEEVSPERQRWLRKSLHQRRVWLFPIHLFAINIFLRNCDWSSPWRSDNKMEHKQNWEMRRRPRPGADSVTLKSLSVFNVPPLISPASIFVSVPEAYCQCQKVTVSSEMSSPGIIPSLLSGSAWCIRVPLPLPIQWDNSETMICTVS